MKKLLSIAALCLSLTAIAGPLENVEGSYQGSYGFRRYDCRVNIKVEGKEVNISIKSDVDSERYVEMRAVDLELSNSRIEAGENIYTGSKNSGFQKEVSLEIEDGNLRSVTAYHYNVVLIGRKLETKIKCNDLSKVD